MANVSIRDVLSFNYSENVKVKNEKVSRSSQQPYTHGHEVSQMNREPPATLVANGPLNNKHLCGSNEGTDTCRLIEGSKEIKIPWTICSCCVYHTNPTDRIMRTQVHIIQQ